VDQLSFDDLEVWKPVVDYEGFYEVSDLGRLRSMRRTIPHGRWPGRSRQTGGRMVAPLVGTGNARTWDGYTRFNLKRDGKQYRFYAHILVAAAFLGPRPDGLQICHGPGGPLDNRLANLSYGTSSKNNGDDKWRDGTITAGVRASTAKLTDEIVREIRVRAAAGEPRATLAQEFGVGKTAIHNAVQGLTWKHVAA
jgi:hypothetical protein